jgi:hypothetical protein
VFLPEANMSSFFLWGPDSPVSPLAGRLRDVATAGVGCVADEELTVRDVKGSTIALLDALPVLAAFTDEHAGLEPASIVAWGFASKLALDLAARERFVPRVERLPDGAARARWVAALTRAEDAERVAMLAKAMPPAAYAVPVHGKQQAERPRRAKQAGRVPARRISAPEVWDPEALLRSFLDTTLDALVRTACGVPSRRSPGESVGPAPKSRRIRLADSTSRSREPWERRFIVALTRTSANFEVTGFTERGVPEQLDTWSLPARGVDAHALKGCFRFHLPEDETAPRPEAGKRAGQRKRGDATEPLRLQYLLQAADDPSLLLDASEIWEAGARRIRRLGRSFEMPQEHLLRSLAIGARLFPPIERSLREARPSDVELDPTEAWTFLTQAAPALQEAGFGVLVPAELTRSGQRRLRLRMRIDAPSTPVAGVVGGRGMGLGDALEFRWEAALGGEALSAADLDALAKLKAPLVRWRGRWIAVDRQELDDLRKILAERGGTIGTAEALGAALAGTTAPSSTSLPVEVMASGSFAALVERLRGGSESKRLGAAPSGFHGKLRGYQKRGVAWLATMADLGLGACLADDMGLGKTIQILAFLLQRRESARSDRRPVLLVCPTSVVGNWEREIARFAPSLPVVRHHGSERTREAGALGELEPGAVVVTTYGLLRRDADVLGAVDWSVAVLDEAQNIKNSASRTARAARALRATHRFALTGTPVENRLAELWSILEFTTPRLLGSLEGFRRQYALPIERYRDDGAAERLRRIVGPFVLRRLKSDPKILRDLPSKNEMRVVCTLTREQASLYQAAVNETMRKIEESEGIQRRGLVLALITSLKQICNHPAQFLGESGPLPGRSGKLERLGEMLEEVVASGDRALVFTQYREMGNRLVAHLGRALPTEILFLHGGVARAARDTMVRRFQEDERAPRVFVLSLKAGGTGLNLTAASHVFHFDRWWNPAVEDQATDRAHRIGQRRAVQVHKFVTGGTVEEKVDRMLEEKRDLASRIVGGSEKWITELGDEALRELFALSSDATVEDADSEPDPGTDAPRARRKRTRSPFVEVPA